MFPSVPKQHPRQALLRASRLCCSHGAAERHARLAGATLEASARAQDAIAMGTQSGGAPGAEPGAEPQKRGSFW